ncbi:MAG: amidohydrolase family protein [Planctomycetes bacterium]|nr:amidohydrolase family protein [Planctomycetota bacterium]
MVARTLIAALLVGAFASAQDLAVRCGKVLTMGAADEIHAPGLVLVEDGKITYVGAPKELAADVPVIDAPDAWLAPGLVDLHTHIHTGGWGDINDMVYSVNPELRSAPTLRPDNRAMQIACAGGVTTLFGIPGSGTNMGGFGVLYKTKTTHRFEDAVVASPGGLKVAQDSNPQRVAGNFGWGNARASMGWTLEHVCNQALAAERAGRNDLRLRDLRRVLTRELPVLIHTAGSDGVVNVARMWKQRYGAQCIVSHGSFDGWKAARAVAELGVPVNHGPRTMDWFSSRNGRINGTAAEYVKAGVQHLSLNTDSNVMPQEELFLQGAMSARLGADSYQMMKALTLHPAIVFGIDDRVGSLEVGKDADLVLYSGDPLDPRTHVERVWIEGAVEYERERGRQRF